MKLQVTFTMAVSALALIASQAVAENDKDKDKDDSPRISSKVALEISQIATGDIGASLTMALGEANSERSERSFTMNGLVATAAAIGNTLTLTDIDTNKDGLNLAQSMSDNVDATLDVDVRNANIFGMDLDAAQMTAAAIGNSLSLDSIKAGDLALEQKMSGEQVQTMATIDLKNVEVQQLDITLAAIGNSATITNLGDYKLLSEQTVENDVEKIQAELDMGSLDGGRSSDHDHGRDSGFLTGETLNITVAAIGNSLTADLFNENEAKVDQFNSAEEVSANAKVNTGSIFNVSLTSAAIGNSATLGGVGGVQLAKINQSTSSEMSAIANVTSASAVTFDATAAAIGNSLSITNVIPEV